jgi:Flp pilus assembly protein TadG
MTRQRLHDQDGMLASELAILMPALLLLIMLAVQFGLWAHASQLARAAADEAAYTAALPGGSGIAGQTAAAGLLAQAGHLTDIRIDIDRTPDTVVATVAGVAPQVVPGFRWSVSATAAAAPERFIPQGDR